MILSPPKRSQSLAHRRRRSRSFLPNDTNPTALHPYQVPVGHLWTEAGSRSTPDLNQVESAKPLQEPQSLKRHGTMATLSVARIQPPVRSSSLNSTTSNRDLPPSLACSPISPKPSTGSMSPTFEETLGCTSTDTMSNSPSDVDVPKTDDEVMKTLSEWKRSSVFRISWTSAQELWNNGNEIFGQLNEVLDAPKREKEIQQAASALWEGNETVVPRIATASYLGQADPFCHQVLRHYLGRFDFSNLRLDEAFRKLCGKVYFKAEAQQIDRILEAFAHRYHDCNVNALYGSPDVVHAVVYSLMLLNTDLHVSHGGHVRMNRTAFCRNTMRTVLDHIGSAQEAIQRSNGLFNWQEEMDECLKELYSSVKQKAIVQPLSQEEKPKPTLLQRMGSIKQRSTPSDGATKHPFNIGQLPLSGDDSLTGIQREKRTDPSTESRMMYKQLSPSSKHDKEWEECLVILDQGSLYFKTSSKHLTIHLGHTITMPYSHEPHRPHALIIQCMENKSYLIDCGSKSDAKKWIHQCNHWAAIQSKIVRHGVSNTKCYGWEPHLLEGQEIVHMEEWTAPQPLTNSKYPEEHHQLEMIQQHLISLQRDLDRHNDLEKRIQLLAKQNPRIDTNWKTKKKHLIVEIEKYTAYRDAMIEKQNSSLPRLLDKRPLSFGMDLLKEINDELELAGGFLMT
ncbi:hypothetical protein DFQ30_003785 [Apophysomyces sp. BC1015]|nr:hypothetical protein DFQ30_003785 [Apophysomyces sp. BC1015]